MEKLIELRSIRSEVMKMDFTYKNVQRLMFLVFQSKSLLESSAIIPNREIAINQVKKVIDIDLMKLIKSEGENQIKMSFNALTESFKLVLDYIA